MLRSKPPQNMFENMPAKRTVRMRTTRAKPKADLIGVVVKNYGLYKSVLRQKISVEQINKGKQVIKVDDAHKITKAHTFATSPRFDADMFAIRK